MRRATIIFVLALACARDEARTLAVASSPAPPTSVTEPAASPARPAPVAAPEPIEPAGTPALFAITLVPEDGALHEQLANVSARARADGRVVVVEMWASWCPPCKKVDALLADPEFAESLAGTALVRLDSDAWGDALDEAGFDAPSIPTFYAVDGRGRPRGKPLSGTAWGRLDKASIAAKLRALVDG